MRKAIFVFFIMLGAAVGLFASLHGDLGLKIVMTGIGALFGTAIGGVLYGRGHRASSSMPRDENVPGSGDPGDERMNNYWLDRVRPTAAPGLPHPEDADPFSREP